MVTNVKKRILIVEDEVDLRMLYTEALREAGFLVFGEGDGRRALELCKRIQYDLIVSDLNIERLNGKYLLDIISKSGPNRKTPTVVISGHSKEMYEEMVRGRAQRFFSKPFPATDLVDAVQDVLKLSQAIAV